MSSRGWLVAAVWVGVWGVAAGSARGQALFYPDDETVPVIEGDPSVVGYQNDADWAARVNGTSPRVSFLSGTAGSLYAYNGSVVSLSGSIITDAVTTYDRSTVTLSNSGPIVLPYAATVFNVQNQSTLNLNAGVRLDGRVNAGEDTTVNVSGGAISGLLQTGGNCTVNVTSGSLSVPRLYGRTTMNISGGTVLSLTFVYDSTTVNISGGTVSTAAYGYGSSTFNITGGSLQDAYFYGYNSTAINFSGGTVKALGSVQNGTINITGGSVLNAVLAAGRTVNVYGGTFNSGTGDADSAFGLYGGVLNFYGTGLTATQVVNTNGLPMFLVSGTLQDGTPLVNSRVVDYRGGGVLVLNNIPDPAILPVLAPVALGLRALLGRRRRR